MQMLGTHGFTELSLIIVRDCHILLQDNEKAFPDLFMNLEQDENIDLGY